MLFQLVKLICLEPNEAELLHLVVEVVAWKMSRRVAGDANAAAVAHYWVGDKVRYDVLCRDYGGNLGVEAFSLVSKETLKLCHP